MGNIVSSPHATPHRDQPLQLSPTQAGTSQAARGLSVLNHGQTPALSTHQTRGAPYEPPPRAANLYLSSVGATRPGLVFVNESLEELQNKLNAKIAEESSFTDTLKSIKESNAKRELKEAARAKLSSLQNEIRELADKIASLKGFGSSS